MREVLLPAALDDLWECLSLYPHARIYAGGTDMLVRLTAECVTSSPLICLEEIQELKEVHDEGGMVFIGSGCTFSTLLRDPLVSSHFPVLTKALSVLGSPPIRNMATIGGNICTASPAGDTLPPLYVLDAAVELRSVESSRLLSLKRFITGPGQVALQHGEILYGIWIRKPEGASIHHFEKVGQRKALAIAAASLAALLKIDQDGVVEKARLAWGSVGPTIVTSEEVEKALLGQPLSIDTLRDAAALARRVVVPIDDVRASKQYRRLLSGNLLMRLFQYSGPAHHTAQKGS